MVLSRDGGTLIYTQNASENIRAETGFTRRTNKKDQTKQARMNGHSWKSSPHKNLLALRHDALIFPSPDILQRPLEVPFRTVEIWVRFVRGGLQVRMDKFNQPVEILRGDCFVLLVEVVDVAVEDLDEEFN